MGQSEMVIVKTSCGQFVAGLLLSVLVPVGMIFTITVLFGFYTIIVLAILPSCISSPILNYICHYAGILRLLLCILGLMSFISNVRRHCSLPWVTILSSRRSAILATDWRSENRHLATFDQVLKVALVAVDRAAMGRKWDEHVCWRLEIQTTSKGCDKIPIYESWDECGSVSFDILKRGIAVAEFIGVKFETGTFVTQDSLAKAQANNQRQAQ